VKRSIVDILLATCPDFLAHWNEFAIIYGGAVANEAALSDVLSEFARYTLELRPSVREAVFPAIASAIFTLHEGGTVEERAQIALLLNFIGHDWSLNGVDPEPFFRHVPPSLRHLCVETEPPSCS
jgi:hypothetical protein